MPFCLPDRAGIECRVARYSSDVLNVKGKRAHWREGRGEGLSEEMTLKTNGYTGSPHRRLGSIRFYREGR